MAILCGDKVSDMKDIHCIETDLIEARWHGSFIVPFLAVFWIWVVKPNVGPNVVVFRDARNHCCIGRR